MIRARSASGRVLQAAISARLRQHPRQWLVAPSTTQTLTQGEAMLGGGPEDDGDESDMNTKYGPAAE